MAPKKFPKVDGKQSFPKLEEKILEYWKKEHIFEESISSRPVENPYRFYDGPPFITGTPHYGSLLSSICKDVIPRYWTMKWKRCERVWGWDCHGLPIEDKVQKKLGIQSNKEIEKVGVKTFIDECYAYTKNTSAEWDWYIDHIGRWVDFKNAYRTMDQDYMETVMWVFKSLWDKQMIYKGQRCSLYSRKLGTPISNFEVAMDDSYAEVSDPAITVMFEIKTTNSVGIVVKNSKWEVLLGKKKKSNLWTLPGGKVEDGETPLQAALRELKEETGIDAQTLKLHSLNTLPHNGKYWNQYIYVVEETHETFENPEADIFHEFSFVALEDFPEENEIEVYDRKILSGIKEGKFGIIREVEHSYLLAWTTTPWTIPAHMAIAVNKELSYAQVLHNGAYYILALARVETVFHGKEYEVVDTFMGERLLDLKYTPPFDYYIGKVDAEKNHKVFNADFVTDTDGTGIAHEAPEFGDVDFQLAKAQGIHISNALDNEGKYTQEIKDLEGTFYQDANNIVTERLKTIGKLFKKESINHRVAMCPRTATPLIYKVQDSWFIDIQSLKEKLIAENENINWYPEHLKHGQFLKSMEWAPDWCISRTRYWWTPMPVWYGYDTDGNHVETKVFGSKKEIEDASGMKITDLHKPYIDDITWNENEITYKRIPEVCDVWLDSGSMPYAQMHYPFENKNVMEASYPADFIVEYIGQVRAWFYVMHVVGVALFGKNSFTNVITTGIVYGTDGRKMSKSYGNYPDPRVTIENYGADAIRFYMMNSPLLSGNNINFSEEGIKEVLKKISLPLWNTYSFFTTYANIDKYQPKEGGVYYCRHGQTDNNKNNIMNGGDDDGPLNEEWRRQAYEAVEQFKYNGVEFDAIIYSPLERAKETAQIIWTQMWGKAEFIGNENLKEQLSGVFKWMNREEIMNKYDLKDFNEFRRYIKEKENNKAESIEEFDERVTTAFKDITRQYEGKNILIVGHSGTIRPILRELYDLDIEEAHFSLDSTPNAKIFKLPWEKTNALDRWIIGELNKLIMEVEENMNQYKIAEAARPIAKFMDNLTNWYIRRSRKRFWKSENDTDKMEAYDTLYDVLITLCKILAPFMPFISEHIYRNLTGRKSVHLESFPIGVPWLVVHSLNEQFDMTAKLVNLGLAWRGKKNLRVRQPLLSASIWEKLDPYFIDIIKEELNVKEVKVLSSSDAIAKKICKPNGKLIGPKFGKDVQTVIKEAKAWNFVELTWGQIKVWEFILENDEYEIAFEKADESLDIESDFGMVIAIDGTLTQELIDEGISRDLVRQIQEARKEAAFDVDNRIEITISGEKIDDIVKTFKDYIEKETLSTIKQELDRVDFEKEVEFEEGNITLKLKKIFL